MRRYLLRRVLYLVPVWLGISLLAFSLANLAPGDPARIVAQRQFGDVVTEEAVQRIRVELGLNDPFPVRYLRWLGQAVQGDFGKSYRTGESVLPSLLERFPATLQIALTALLFGLIIALPLGMISAVHRNSWVDHLSRLGALLGTSIPSFWLGYILIIIFAVTLKILPVAGRGGPQHLILPALTLGLGAASSLTRLTRATLLQVLDEEYLTTARSKGLSGRAVILRHALKNALIPVITVLGTRFGQLLGGSVIVETVFAWPGIGKYVVDSIYDRDYPTIQGFVLFMGTVFVLVNLLVDLSYMWLDPRVRLAGRIGQRYGST